MANIKCANCGQSISSKAPACPGCGHPNKQSANLSVWQVVGGLAIGIGVIWYMASGGANSSPSQDSPSQAADAAQVSAPPTPAAPAIKVGSLDLFNAYQANEVAADEKYKGKTLDVTGIVDSINKDFTDSVYLVLQTPNEFMGTHAELQPQDIQKAASLSKGTQVVVRCNGGGMMVGSVMLNHCTLE